MDYELLCTKVCAIARLTGNFIRKESMNFDAQKIEFKGLNDLVSYVDKQAEQQLVANLSKVLPNAGFTTEEETINSRGEVFNWIIDPLDGTTNFIHGIPTYSISIALYGGYVADKSEKRGLLLKIFSGVLLCSLVMLLVTGL
ncbi:MAG: hypothetical protein EOO88_26280 [Pedobacter sp.]|nr:MAG: hypothetical protein EOO88_26280 [Pedobacter sp.]